LLYLSAIVVKRACLTKFSGWTAARPCNSLLCAVRVGVYLTDMGNFAAMNSVFAEFFEQPFPARTTVQTGFPTPEMLVEIDAIVAVPPAT